MRRSKTYLAATCMALVACMTVAVGTAVARPSDLNLARAATGAFHDIATAEAAGYGLPPAGVPLHECITNPLGTMGFHWINGNLLDTTLDPSKPEALVYQPDRNGNLHLGALEYVVFQAPWDAAHAADPAHFPALPTLFGHDFALVPPVPGDPNGNTVFQIPPFYQLHVWLWNSNPTDMFFPWNPSVSCDGAAAAAAKNPAIGTINARLAAAVGRFACHIRARNS